MEFLITMTTHIPDGALDQAVGLRNAWNPAGMLAIFTSPPVAPWMTAGTTPLSQYPIGPQRWSLA